MVKSYDQIRKRKKDGARIERAASPCRIPPDRFKWRRRSTTAPETILEQAVEADFDQTLPISTRELDAVRRLLGDDLALFLRSLSGH